MFCYSVRYTRLSVCPFPINSSIFLRKQRKGVVLVFAIIFNQTLLFEQLINSNDETLHDTPTHANNLRGVVDEIYTFSPLTSNLLCVQNTIKKYVVLVSREIFKIILFFCLYRDGNSKRSSCRNFPSRISGLSYLGLLIYFFFNCLVFFFKLLSYFSGFSSRNFQTGNNR